MGDAQLLSADDISGRLQTPPSGLLPPPDAGGGPLSPPPSPMEFFAPTGAAVDDYVHYLNNDAAFQFGFKQIDLCFPSGLDKGDMALILGKSHQGKSTVTYSAIINNLERSEDFTCVFYSPDEPRELAVQKMACMALGLNAAKMEEDLKAGDTGALRKIQNVANGLLDRVLINDQSLTFASMLRGIYEAEDYWQRPVSACVLDYLELLAGDSDANGVAGKHKPLNGSPKTPMYRSLCCIKQAVDQVIPANPQGCTVDDSEGNLKAYWCLKRTCRKPALTYRNVTGLK